MVMRRAFMLVPSLWWRASRGHRRSLDERRAKERPKIGRSWYDTQSMEFRILGPVEVVDGGHPVAVGGGKPRALLGALLLRANEAVSVERLVDELWGEEPPETARSALQVHVSQLRKALGADVVVRRGGGYALAVDPEAVDLVRFERLVARAREARAAEAAGLYRDALSPWRG